MSKLIENKATITYNDNQEDKTCPVPTVVYKYGKRIHKLAATSETGLIVPPLPTGDQKVSDMTASGEIGEDGIVNYILEVFNPLPTPMHNIVVTDTLVGLPTGSKLISSYPDGITLNDTTKVVTMPTITKLESEEMQRFQFQIKVPEGTPQGTVITDQATMNHQIDNPDYNPEDEQPGPEFLDADPLKSETITVTMNNADVEAKKTAPENVIAGEDFDYNVTFTNDGQKPATVNKITDNLPDGFVLNPVLGASNPVLTIGGVPVNTADYEVKIIDVTEGGKTVKQLVVTPATGKTITIPAGQTLSMVLSGNIPA